MATSQRPSAVATRAEPARQLSVLDREEISALTNERARAFIEAQISGTGVTFERVMAEALNAVLDNPKLLEANKISLVRAVARIASWGLTIGEKAFLVPFKGQVKAIRGYMGDAELVINAGGARFIDAFNFYEKEPFEHSQGSNPYIKHTPLSPAVRGKLIGSYAVAIVSQALPPKIKVMYNEEIDAIRLKNSHEWKNGTLDSLPSHFYGPKTCVKQICKLLPTNPRMEKVLKDLDVEEAEFEIVDEADQPTGERIEAGASAASPAAEPARKAADDQMQF